MPQVSHEPGRRTLRQDVARGPWPVRACGMPWHTIEREQLAEALSAVAPDAPTLCEGWQARHLAAHVVLRERAPVVGLALVVPALSGRSEAAIARLADESA